MPGFYPVDEYDLAGFAVGVVDEKDLITGKDLKEKDVLIGIASSGVHSNGFSLVRKVFSMDEKTLNTYHEELGKTLGEALMLPEGVRAVIRKDSYEVPAIFKMLAREGQIEEQMMYNTYNMGIGMVVAVDPTDVDKTMKAIEAAGETAYVIGEIENGEKGVTLC